MTNKFEISTQAQPPSTTKSSHYIDIGHILEEEEETPTAEVNIHQGNTNMQPQRY
jgi:hypothetical protein